MTITTTTTGRKTCTTAITTSRELRDIGATLLDQCRQQGYEQALRDWCTPLFDRWLTSLTQGRDHTTRNVRLRLAVGIRENLAIRDALLVTAITRVDTLPTMVQVAAQPHDEETKTLITRALSQAFDDPTATPTHSAPEPPS